MKHCSKCGEKKPLDEFKKHKGCVEGRQNICKVCNTLYRKQYNKTDVESRKYAHIRRRYNLSKADFDKLHENHNGLCGLCGELLGDKYDIDHCHKTGAVRGIIHRKCNWLLGAVDDSIPMLQGAIEYLKRSMC